MSTPSSAHSRLLAVLDQMEIPYHVGGSVASSAHGKPRTTLDIDIVVDLKPDQIREFAAALQDDFYADAAFIEQSFSQSRAANLIHYGTAWKFDLFTLQPDDYSQTSFARRFFREVRPDGRDAVEYAMGTVEDTILRKLEWYQIGGGTSARQWGDLRGMCESAGSKLDREYLRRWAPALGVADLLEALLAEF